MVTTLNKLPIRPYKGLGYYGPEDSEIFAARDEDVSRCSRVLADEKCRVLILHGRTGCGKSSFLRAGLIPHLEKAEHAFQFSQQATKSPGALFVRCTDEPLVRIAERIYLDVTEGHHEIRTPDGRTQDIDLTPVLMGEDRNSFIERLGSTPALLIESLSILASLLPRTQVIMIDQAEEVLTLRQDQEGIASRELLFEFLAMFSRSRIDVKVMVALRTEWYGQFYNAIRQREWDPLNIRDYLLGELSQSQIALAIEHPSSLAQYNYSFEDGLAGRIASDLVNAPLQGGVLPVMQIICERLYDDIRMDESGSKTQITKEQYEALGGVAEQLDNWLRGNLSELCQQQGFTPYESWPEIKRWGQALASLVRTQIDGTVTTDFRTREQLLSSWQSGGCRIPFDSVSGGLTDPNRRILQETEIFDPTRGQAFTAYSLGHDAVGLALKTFLATASATSFFDQRFDRYLRISGLVLGVLAGMSLVIGILSGNSTITGIGGVGLGYGVLLVTASYLPDRYRRIFIPRPQKPPRTRR